MKRNIRFSTARQVFEAFATAANDIETPPTSDDPLVFLRALLDGPTPEDAVSFCAYLLPRREAVWWACQCLRQIGGPLSPVDLEHDRAAVGQLVVVFNSQLKH